jgi:hypothetical protein
MSEIKIDKIIRSNRKTIALEVTRDATLVVRAPELAAIETIRKIVAKKSNWINRKISHVRGLRSRTVEKEFVNGEGFLYMGNAYMLHILENGELPLSFDRGFYLQRRYLPIARELFVEWYKSQAQQKISERVHWYASQAGLKYKSIKITEASKRWGSCGSNGNLNFSWRLIMAPLGAIDYVVVHELAHLEVKSHSNDFWNKVKVMFPDYERYRRWLKDESDFAII